MSDLAIRAVDLSKKYRIGGPRASYRTVREALVNAAAAPVRRAAGILHGRASGANGHDEIWALKDVSFEIRRGEVVGVIGPNGAGKSTLLKILSRITRPTEGYADIYGRVGSLLEVGTGFHPELTGRENVYLSGAVLGMRRAEIERRFDEIVDFAGVQKFIDTPVKHFSSGMYLRLAFAVAAHLDPEILLVDEVLAVGDAEFQKKCLGKMGEVAHEGRTVIVVSHNMQSISTMTDSAIVLNDGNVKFEGSTAAAIEAYLGELAHHPGSYVADPEEASPTVTRVELVTSEPGNVQVHGKPMDVVIELTAPAPLDQAVVSFQVFNAQRQPALHLWWFQSGTQFSTADGVCKFVCRIPRLRLYLGHYTLTVHFSERLGKKNVIKIEDICPFEVTMYGHHRDLPWTPFACAYVEDADWTINQRQSRTK